MQKTKRIKNRKLLDEVKARPCLICLKPSDPCHIRGKGAGGDDSEENLLSLCRTHHRFQHDMGWARFCQRYPEIIKILDRKGWVIMNTFGISKLVRK